MNLGIIGFGNLGKSFVKGVINNQALVKEKIFVAEKRQEARSEAINSLGVNAFEHAGDVVRKADLIILAVKPYQIEELLREISSHDLKSKVFVSFAAGTSLLKLRSNLPQEVVLFRAMPNISVITGDGVIGISGEEGRSLPEEMGSLFGSLGAVIEMDEVVLDKITALSACGLAYVAEFMEAFIEAGLSFGMPQDMVKQITAQTFIGTAQTLLDEKIGPDDFIKMVATPGGATEQGILSLRKHEVKQSIIDAIMASYNKACKLS